MCGQAMSAFKKDQQINHIPLFFVRGLYFALVIFDRVKRAPDSNLDSFRWDLLCNKNFQAEDQSDMQVIE